MKYGRKLRSNFASFRRLLADVRGATAIEYALIASGISIFILTGVSALGTSIMETFYNNITSMF